MFMITFTACFPILMIYLIFTKAEVMKGNETVDLKYDSLFTDLKPYTRRTLFYNVI